MNAAETGPNTQQVAYWNDEAGAKWVKLEEMLDAQIAPLGLEVMERSGLAEGEQVLDVGCGCGQTSLQLAERVGPSGRVTGIDLSRPMLERARERARHLSQVAFVNADAQVHEFPAASLDLVFSRFGVMFFSNPEAAFANLRGALRASGRLAFVCWQGIERNDWMRVPLMAVAAHVALPAPPAPGAPGPFGFADAERVRGILERAGFQDVRFEGLECELAVGGRTTLEQTAHFVLQMGPAGAAMREAGEQASERVLASVLEALAPYAGADGVRMPGAAWVVRARA